MASEDTGQGPTRPIASCLEAATLKQLVDLDDGQMGLLAELFGLFKDDTPSRLADLKTCQDTGDAGTASELAHALKGAAGTIGAKRMREIAQSIEKAGKAGRVDAETAQWLAELESAYAEACAALDAYLRQG
jgi:HPt (histidine-containing phosphotransfer) domain-containing protein